MGENYYADCECFIAPGYLAEEEFANALTHGIGLLISVSALIYMISIMPPDYSMLEKTCARKTP
jgi:predicted membrane channel-forming protein YqfA (hemolysin III family)